MPDLPEIDANDIQPVVDTSDAPVTTQETEVSQPEAEPVRSKSLDDAISKAMEDTGYGEETITDSQGRVRDAKTKRFVKTAAEATEQVPAETAAVTAETTKVGTAQQPPQALPMSEAEKAIFAKLPADAQKWISTRHQQMEADYTRKTQALAETRKGIEALDARVQYWSPYLQKLNVSPEKAFEDMLSTEYVLRTGNAEQKVSAFKYLADTYGVDLSLLAGGQSPGQQQIQQQQETADDEWVDPRVAKLEGELGQVSSILQQMQRQAEEAEFARNQAAFAEIGRQLDSNGQPKYPHFNVVGKDMIRLVAEGQVDNWDDAYEAAVYSRKDLRASLLEQQKAQLLAEEDARRKAAVEKARGAAPVRVTPGVGEKPTGPRGLSAHLNAAIDRLTS